MSDIEEIEEIENIDNILNSDDSTLDINADTETINNQLDKKNKKNQQTEQCQVIHIDKNMLKTLIIEWLSLDDQIKSYNDIIKDLKEEKKQFETQILDIMGVLNQEIIITDKGNLTKTIKESKEPLTPDLIKASLSELLKCIETADTYTNHIMEKRKVKEIVNLKRKEVNEKKKGKKEKKNK
jgi:hypothetical protein